MKKVFTYLFAAAIVLFSASAFAQVTITSSDTISCTTLCTTLTAHLTGDSPTDAGITIDDQYPDLPNPIGFTFNFYGIPYTQCYIGPNGTICFNTGLGGMFETWIATGPLLGQVPVENSICGPWCDVDVEYGGTITYSTTGIAPNRKFIITFCHVAMFSCTSQYYTTQMILYETSNLIEVHVGHKDICPSWYGAIPGLAILGVQNATGTDAVVAPGHDYPSVYTCSDEGWRFTPISTPAGTPSYTVSSIPYAPVPLASSAIYWYNATTGAYIDTGTSITICSPPAGSTTYKAGALGCDGVTVGGVATSDTSFGYYTITAAPTITAAIAIVTNPSICGACDGSIVVSGLTPGAIDTINYTVGGVAQPPIIATVSAGGTMTIAGLCSGTYSNIIAKQATCISSPMTATLVDPPIAISSVGHIDVDSCGASNGKLILNGLYPNHSFTVNFTKNGVAQPPVTVISNSAGVITISGLAIGAYANIIASYGACTTPAAGPDTIKGPPPPLIYMTDFTSPTQCGYCDGTITIHYIAPYSSDTVFYSLNGTVMPTFLNIAQPDGTVYIQGLCAGDYSDFTVKVGDCPSIVSGEAVLVNPRITPSFSYVNHFGCNGDTVMFTNHSTASGPLYYIWNFGDSVTDTATNPSHIFAQGIYTITLTANDHVCDTTFTLTDSLIHPLHATFIDTPFIYCQNTPVTLSNTTEVLPGGPLTYKWLFGDGQTDTATSTVHTYPKAGVYNVQLIATNFVPCSDTQSLSVYIDSSSAISLTVTDSVICRSSSITFTGKYSNIGNVGITWKFGDGDSTVNINPITHSFDVVGTYTVTATARYRKCADTSVSKQFTIFGGPSIDLGADTSICIGSEALTLTDMLNAGNTNATWVWSTGATTPSITVVEPGSYYARVGINGCYATDTVEVTNDCYMNIPNVFSPNNDGVNDYFYPMQYLSKGLTSFKLDVYNRWGQLLFEGTALDGRGWDGKFNGVDQPEGVYVYVIDAKFKDGQKQHHRGNITLLR